MLSNVSCLVADGVRVHLAQRALAPQQVFAVLKQLDEPILEVAGTEADGTNVVFSKETGWQRAIQDAKQERECSECSFQDRRVLCRDSEFAGFLGYGTVHTSHRASDTDSEMLTCVFPTLQGAELEVTIPAASAVLLADTIQADIHTAGGASQTIDVTDIILDLEDEDIRELRDGSPLPLPEPLREGLRAEGIDPDNDALRVDLVEAICDYFGGHPEALPSGGSKVPESIFTEALENTTQCRLLRDLEMRRDLRAGHSGHGMGA